MPESEISPDATVNWWESIRDTLKANEVELVTYVPDRVLAPLIDVIHEDNYFTAFAAAREEEAVGILGGAWMGGMRGILLMQSSGFATLANVLASFAVPYQLPIMMIISERGTMGEYNLGQVLACRTIRPVLDSLSIEHYTISRPHEIEFIVDRSVKQACLTWAPVAFILSPLLTRHVTES